MPVTPTRRIPITITARCLNSWGGWRGEEVYRRSGPSTYTFLTCKSTADWVARVWLPRQTSLDTLPVSAGRNLGVNVLVSLLSSNESIRLNIPGSPKKWVECLWRTDASEYSLYFKKHSSYSRRLLSNLVAGQGEVTGQERYVGCKTHIVLEAFSPYHAQRLVTSGVGFY